MDILIISVIMACATIGIPTMCTAIAQGMSVCAAMNGISRQPEASGTLGTNLIIGLAFIESLTIYTLVIALLLLFANPFAKAQKDINEAKSKVELLKMEAERIQVQAQIDALKKTETLPAK